MSRSTAVPTVLAVLVAVVLAACGSDDSGGSSTADNAAATSATQAAPAPATTSQPAEATTSQPAPATTSQPAEAATRKDSAKVMARCRKTYDPIMAQLRRVQASTKGKAKYGAYGRSMVDLQILFNNFTPARDGTACLEFVGAPAAASYLQFDTATRAWSGCRAKDECTSAAMRYVKDRWRVGGDNLGRAREGRSTVVTSS